MAFTSAIKAIDNPRKFFDGIEIRGLRYAPEIRALNVIGIDHIGMRSIDSEYLLARRDGFG